MTKVEVAKLVGILLASFPSVRANDGTSAAYERMLADLEYHAASAALERLLATARFMPTIAEIRETTLAITVGERKPGGEAWGAVLRAIGSEGVYRVPGRDFVFKDEVTARCVDALGWEELCNSENQAADRARFIELYDQLAVNARRRQLSDALPAMQRFRALEAKRTAEIEARTGGGADAGAVVGKLLSLVAGKEDPS